MKDENYLQHIRDAIKAIDGYMDGFDYESFSQDKKTIDAVVYQLAVIGEAANNLGSDFRSKHPSIPWRNMVDMRNFVIHEYFGINPETVWSTVADDLPKLKGLIDDILFA
ncbi:MAG: DUF86 domain-containing protein [Candidatus Moranbacteria bacterium]|nr:DUF86 domain-containing protein [Candidatus Moranbacteria bacterium]